MRKVMTGMAVVLAMTSVSQAALVWTEGFADGVPGVVDVRTDNPNGTVMINDDYGNNSQIITMESLNTTVSNKAGRELNPGGSSLQGGGSRFNAAFSALYNFKLSRLEGAPGTTGHEFFAGFVSPQQAHSTGQYLGAGFIRDVEDNGDHVLYARGRMGSVRFLGAQVFNADPINLGPNPENRPLQLAIGFDGTTLGDERIRVSLHDGVTGVLLSEANRTFMGGALVADCGGSTGCPVRWAFNAFGGADPGNAAWGSELENFDLSHLGWMDYIAASNDVETDFSMHSMSYYDGFTGAFNDIVPEPATGLLLMGGLAMLLRRRR